MSRTTVDFYTTARDAALGLTLIVGAMGAAHAALPTGAILQFDSGLPFFSCITPGANPTDPGGCPISARVTDGSYFAMDTDGDSTHKPTERTPLAPGPDGGLIIGKTQAASGSHQGPPDGSETPGMDLPWDFFNNTGIHLTSGTPVTDDGAGAVDMRGWVVSWNGIPIIPMGENPKFGDTGFGTIVCDSDPCQVGDHFELDYPTHVPEVPATGFENVFYSVHLEGTIVAPSGVTASAGTVGAGSLGNGDGRATLGDLTAASIPADEDFNNVGGFFDFTVSGLGVGDTVLVQLPLTSAIESGSVYRKYAGSWSTFATGGADSVASGASVSDSCEGIAYSAGLTEGHDCVQLSITDGGLNDADGAADGTVTDPGGVGKPTIDRTQFNTDPGSSGCTLSETPVHPAKRADWWLLAGFLAVLGLVQWRRKPSF